MRQLRPKLAGPSNGRRADSDGEGVAQCSSVSVSCISFHAAIQSADASNCKVLAESRLTCSVWSDEWIRILCNDYFLASVIGYTDYFEVIVTLDPITKYPPTPSWDVEACRRPSGQWHENTT